MAPQAKIYFVSLESPSEKRFWCKHTKYILPAALFAFKKVNKSKTGVETKTGVWISDFSAAAATVM